MQIKDSTEVMRREEFADFCNKLGLKGTALEIGVHRGEYAYEFLSRWEGEIYIGIDPWTIPDDYHDIIKNPDRSEDYETALSNLAKCKQGIRILRGLSSEMLKFVDDNSVDFLYIDANHSYKHVKEDIELSWSKVVKNGILAGHDYDDEFPGCKRAVHEFMDSMNIQVYLTNERGYRSWYCIK